MNHINMDKFSETSLSIRTIVPVKKNQLTLWNLLLWMMKLKTDTIQSKQEMTMALYEAYGLKAAYGMTAYGDQLVIDAKFQWIRTDWIEDTDYTSNLIHLIDQLLFHAYLDISSLEEAKYFLKNRLLRLKDDPDFSAYEQALSLVEGNHAVSFPMHGKIEEINTISLEDVKELYSFYCHMDKSVYVCGVLNDSLKEYLTHVDCGKPILNVRHLIESQDFHSSVLKKDILQTSLVQVYATHIDVNSSLYIPLVIFCSLLGQSPKNLLFDSIREKESLCYSIHSQMVRFDGALSIHAGIQSDNVDKVVGLIEKAIHQIITKQYSDSLLDIAKKDWIDECYANQDRPFAIIERAFLNDYLDRQLTLEKLIEKIQLVSKEDVSKVAKRLEMISQSVIEENEYED